MPLFSKGVKCRTLHNLHVLKVPKTVQIELSGIADELRNFELLAPPQPRRTPRWWRAAGRPSSPPCSPTATPPWWWSWYICIIMFIWYHHYCYCTIHPFCSPAPPPPRWSSWRTRRLFIELFTISRFSLSIAMRSAVLPVKGVTSTNEIALDPPPYPRLRNLCTTPYVIFVIRDSRPRAISNVHRQNSASHGDWQWKLGNGKQLKEKSSSRSSWWSSSKET